MTGKEIRKKFLDYFATKGHAIVPSSSLVPQDDPSVLLTTAGMQQFKPYFLGKESPWGNRVASVQKSFRTSDIEEVGDETHLTFFEMLGNFSFNYPHGKSSYFKEEAIKLGLEFVQEVLGIDRKRISVSVFGGDSEVPIDTESHTIWKKLGFADSEIKKGNREDNFWGPTGNEGPCGPTTEIIIDGVEVWNLVFNEYLGRWPKVGSRVPEPVADRSHPAYYSGGEVGPLVLSLTPLRFKGVDTGMGLERLATVVQKVSDIFETDLLAPLMNRMPQTMDVKVKRILVDHIRGIAFLISDGLLPSSDDRGAVLRRLIRRTILFFYKSDADFFASFAQAADMLQADSIDEVIEDCFKVLNKNYGEFHKELHEEKIIKVFGDENTKFKIAIRNALVQIAHMEKVDTKNAFKIHQSIAGLDFDLIKELAGSKAEGLSREAFDAEVQKHKEISRVGQENKFGGHGMLSSTGEIVGGTDQEKKRILRMHTATHLLHQALRDMFGDTVQQKGSDINGERLRFDFSHNEKLTPEQVKKVEAIVNEKITNDLPVYRKEMPQEEAAKTGALAFFTDKYGGTVSVYFIGSEDPVKAYSKEFCAGPHVTNTKEIGEFKILKEEAVGAGVRRIKATVS